MIIFGFTPLRSTVRLVQEMLSNFVFVLLCTTLIKIASSQCQSPQSSVTPRKWRVGANADRSENGYYFVGSRYRSAKCYDFHQCSFICVRDARCKSFNYLGDIEICELNADDRSSLVGGRPTWVLLDGKWLQQDHGLVQKEHSTYCNRDCFENVLPEDFVPTVCNPPCMDDELCSPHVPSGEGICVKTVHSVQDFLLPWSEWSAWSSCSLTCGFDGHRTRTRTCGPGRQEWMCKGTDSETSLCENRARCPHWADWGSWTSCSTAWTCGDGTRNRSRTCESGGYDVSSCQGPPDDVEKCRTPSCHSPVLLTSDTYGYVLVSDDTDPLLFKWRTVCKDRIQDHELPQVVNVVCRQLGLYAGYPTHLTELPVDAKMRLRLLDCDNNPKYLIQCNHLKWRWGSCDELLQVQCVEEASHQHHYIAEITWQHAFDYCLERFTSMCSFDQVFPYGNTTAIWEDYGDTWVPIRDTYNDWAQLGLDDRRLGKKHSVLYGLPSWGTQEIRTHYKGNFLCCVLE